jgi:two-component system chemotaxis response regulator CheY
MPQRLLIVDDSPVMHRLIARIISTAALPIECLSAASGRDALDLLRQAKADLILTDYHMPAMNGEEFIGMLQQDPGLRDIPVVVMSTDATRARVSRMAAAGVSGYLSKPFTPELLCKEITRALGGCMDGVHD